MNRLQKKCFIVATGMHCLLIGIVVFGSAFFVAHDSVPVTNQFKVIPLSALTDAPTTGGSPDVKVAPPSRSLPPPETKANPEPKPPAVKQTQPVTHAEPPPKPPVDRLRPPPDKHHPLDRVEKSEPEPVKHGPKLDPKDLQPVKRTDSKTTKIKPTDTSHTEAQERAAERERQREIGEAVRNLGHDLSSPTAVTLPGPGGETSEVMANYAEVVVSTYYAAWNPPAGMQDSNVSVVVRVTISRDGKVISHEIKRKSGDVEMDRSVERTLENVTFVAEFPAGSKESERSFLIRFIPKR